MLKRIVKKHLYNFYWTYKTCGLKKIKQDKELLLVLGVGRSGTTWVSNTLAKTTTPIRFFEEPLYHIVPKMSFSKLNDQTSIKYKELSKRHRLLKTYKIFTNNDSNYRIQLNEKFVKRYDASFEKVLVKEVHSLLVAEQLATKLDCKIIFITRSPFFVVDSIYAAQTAETIYLKNEFLFIRSHIFLNRFFKKNIRNYQVIFNSIDSIEDKQKKTTYNYILSIHLINKMFNTINKEYSNVMLVDYNNLVTEPELYFSKISEFLGILWKPNSFIFTKETHNNKKYSLNRDIKKQINRPFKILSELEIEEIKTFFKEYGINL